MASANEPGTIYVMVERSGHFAPLWTGDSTGPVAAGKSPDGVLANLTIDKQLNIPIHPRALRGGDIIHLFFKARAADGYDVSDCVLLLPIRENGMQKSLTMADLGATTDIPAATPASQLFEFGTGYTIPNNVTFAQFGGGPLVISIEDDTA